jgi:1,4-alpha-glucan branching enzyme
MSVEKLFAVFAVSVSLAAAVPSVSAARLKKMPAASSAALSDATSVKSSGVEFVYTDASAKNVSVAGSFNDWNPSKNPLAADKKGVWRLMLSLPAGSHQYKFVVDGNWKHDPSNPSDADDGHGGKNSLVEVKKSAASAVTASGGLKITKDGAHFVYRNPSAKTVNVAGDFNHWNASSDALTKQKDGSWRAVKKLPVGKYNYKFVVDGNWLPDPDNTAASDDGYGGRNSVIEISAATLPPGSATRAIKAGVEFVYDGAAAGVSVSGSFNSWNQSSHLLSKDKSGIWKTVVPLGKGKHQYKFVVDGNWLPDPGNPEISEDGYGGQNSVIEVK